MKFKYLSGLIEEHDIVLVGFRGVDGSVVLDCPEVSQAFESDSADMLDRESLENFADAYSQCAARLENAGIDTSGYTIDEVVEDIETARRALGYEKVNLISGSYGTRLAMIYAWMYPDSIHRSAMVSVNPPGHFVWDPRVIDNQIEHYSDLCALDSKCSNRTRLLRSEVGVD